jgi:hypothetical protein
LMGLAGFVLAYRRKGKHPDPKNAFPTGSTGGR